LEGQDLEVRFSSGQSAELEGFSGTHREVVTRLSY
jgi:hypothetical protein